MPYPTFDRSRLKIQPLANRIHDLNLNCLVDKIGLVGCKDLVGFIVHCGLVGQVSQGR